MADRVNWTAECAAFAVMLGLSVAVGLHFGCARGGQNAAGAYLLGGKQMSVFPIAVSLIARFGTSVGLFVSRVPATGA
jgi:hypothetical protein